VILHERSSVGRPGCSGKVSGKERENGRRRRNEMVEQEQKGQRSTDQDASTRRRKTWCVFSEHFGLSC
jgi:hypothetical protein